LLHHLASNCMKFLDGEILYIATSTILLLVSLIVSFKKQASNNQARRFLALYFCCYFYAMFVTWLILYGGIVKAPHFFRTAYIAWALVMPASYLYVLQTLYPRSLKWYDLLHLLVAIIYIIDYLPFFLLPAHAKLDRLNTMTGEEIRAGFNEGWLMPHFGYQVLRTLQLAGYLIAQVLLVRRASRSADHAAVFENPLQLSWLKFMTGSQFLLLMGPLIAAVFFNNTITGVLSTFGALTVSVIQTYFLVFHPQVLYGYSFHQAAKEAAIEEANTTNIGDLNPVKATTYFSEETLAEVGQVLNDLMENHKPYLKPGYKLADLAADSGTSIHKISAYINSIKGMNFYTFLNQYRINYCLDKLRKGEQQDKTLEALATESGFQNRSTFIRAFKAVTQLTPSEYINKKQ
jgi:AraC-like DNA-binding protein